MTTKTIPTVFVTICDCCGAEGTSATAAARLPHWAVVTVNQAAVDYQGQECADASVRLDLCPDCRGKMVAAINAAAAGIQAGAS